MLANPLWVILVGVLAGLMPGLFGAGGGWLLVPVMVLCLGISWGLASGTALCAILAGSVSGVVATLLASEGDLGNVGRSSRRSVGTVMVAAGAVGTVLGKVALRDPLSAFGSATLVLDGVLAVVLVGTAGRLFYELAVGYTRDEPQDASPGRLVGIGLLTLIPGVLSGLTGIGGGILYIAVLMFLMRWRADPARAVSRMVVLASAFVGSALYGWSGGVHFPTAVGMFIPAGIVGVATSAIPFSSSMYRRRLFKFLAGAFALVALALTVAHALHGGDTALPREPGGVRLALLASLVPLGWGASCALARHVVVKRWRSQAELRSSTRSTDKL